MRQVRREGAPVECRMSVQGLERRPRQFTMQNGRTDASKSQIAVTEGHYTPS